MKISLVVPTYNKLPRLKLTILSLENQTYSKEDFEVIFVDDGSNDGTEEYIKSHNFLFNCKYVRTPNRGRSSARNKGVELSKYGTILFIDDDVLLPPRFIGEHAKLQSLEPRVVHGRIVNMTYLKFFKDPVKGILYEQFADMEARSSTLRTKCICERDIVENFHEIESSNKKINSIENAIEKVFAADKKDVLWMGFTGGNVSVPKDSLLKAGMFDTGFGLKWGSEDLETGYRLCKLGCRFSYSFDAVNYHMAHFRHTFDSDYNYTSEYFYNKHKDRNIYHIQEFISGRINSEQLVSLLTEDNIA